MKSAPGRWVSGDDFFGREAELKALATLVRDGNHVLLTGQRRMGKTSIARELGRRLGQDGWTCVFTDLEGATRAEDAVADIEAAAGPILPFSTRASRYTERKIDWLRDRVSEAGGVAFHKPNAGNWRRRGGDAIRACAAHERRVLLVADELPILLTRMVRDDDDGPRQVDEFLSWMRGAIQAVEGDSPVVVVSGSIGLQPLARRLGLSDRINHLHPYRLGAWDRVAVVACFKKLAASNGLRIEDGVADAVYDKLGLGVPQHVQSFFACLQDFAQKQGTDRVTKSDVDKVYCDKLLGPSRQDDVGHYKTRLKGALDDGGHDMAMEILAEAATEKVFSVNARRDLERLYIPVLEDAPERVAEALRVLEDDGYLEFYADNGHRFRSRLLRDWWAADFRGHRASLADRLAKSDRRTPR